jgi:hypothetical protein
MDECTMVIGVIERQYGTPFDDWGPFPQYKELASTHAELHHALNTGERVLIYVRTAHGTSMTCGGATPMLSRKALPTVWTCEHSKCVSEGPDFHAKNR